MSQRLNSYFGATPELRQLSGKAGKLLTLQRLYEQIAPPALTRASRVLQLDRQLLTLAADNGAVAAKLRQLAPELANLFKNRGCEVTGIQVRVQVTAPAIKPPAVPAALSATGRERLLESAEKMADSPLKSALERLAGKGAKP